MATLTKTLGLISILGALLLTATPTIVSAETLPTSGNPSDGGSEGTQGEDTNTGGQTVQITNPLDPTPNDGNVDAVDPQTLILNIIRYALGFVGIVAVSVLIYGGFLYITSTGSQDRINSAKSVITYAIVGIFVIGLSILLVNAIISVLNDASAPQEEIAGPPAP